MNILVIGNGFDLAHGLPTKYGDFLRWAVVQVRYKKYFEKLGKGNINLMSRKLLNNEIIYGNNGRLLQEKIYDELINYNIWIDYFLQSDVYQKENWIDFESEISNVIQSIDNDMHGMAKVYKLEDEIERLSNGFLNQIYDDSQLTFKDLRDRLLSDLNKLIRAFEIYLCNYVEKIEVNRRSPDIESLEDIGYILSFNYTDTYRSIYDTKKILNMIISMGKLILIIR